jgi:hypothetical protein
LVEANAAELRSTAHDTSEQAAPRLEIPAAESQASPVRANPVAALPDDVSQTITYNSTKTGSHFCLAAANMQVYQERLLDMSLTNMQCVFELAHRLATMRSPLDIFGITAEFTSKRIALFEKQVYQTAS